MAVRVSAVLGDIAGTLNVATDAADAATVLTPRGVLDSSTYRSLRDRIIKAALEQPRAVIVDVSHLTFPAESALAVFTSARWHVGRWPEVPIVLVCEHLRGRSAIARNGVTRYVPVYETVPAAMDSLAHSGQPRLRRRARAQLPADLSSLQRSRELVTDWLSAWSQPDMIPVAKVIITTFVENVLRHTASPPGIRLETDGSMVTIAVEDGSHCPAVFKEDLRLNNAPAGMRIVSALCLTWGNAPTPSGKTVWAVVGPDNVL